MEFEPGVELYADNEGRIEEIDMMLTSLVYMLEYRDVWGAEDVHTLIDGLLDRRGELGDEQ